MLTERGVERVKEAVRAAERGKRVGGGMREWHWIYLRREEMVVPEEIRGRGERWDEEGLVEVASPSWGTAAYVLSKAGAKMLLASLVAYEAPLDVMVGQLQQRALNGSNRFVALSACRTGKKFVPGCPENVREMPREMRTDCEFSATQAGERLSHDKIPNRRIKFIREIYKNVHQRSNQVQR